MKISFQYKKWEEICQKIWRAWFMLLRIKGIVMILMAVLFINIFFVLPTNIHFSGFSLLYTGLIIMLIFGYLLLQQIIRDRRSNRQSEVENQITISVKAGWVTIKSADTYSRPISI